MSGHASLPPSSAKEWGACPAWLRLHKDLPPDEGGEAARWGTEVHEVAAQAAAAWAQNPNAPLPLTGDGERDEVVTLWAQHCLALMRESCAFGGEFVGIEAKVRTNHRLHDAVWGTVDFYVYDVHRRTLYVRDLKTGRSEVAPDDPQLICYAVGVMERLGLDDTRVVVDLGVVQPRCFTAPEAVRSVRMDGAALRLRANKLHLAAEANVIGTAPAVAGSHCKYCRARLSCPAFLHRSAELSESTLGGGPLAPTPLQLGAQLTWAREAIRQLESHEQALAGAVEGLLTAGVDVAGWSMGRTTPREQWTQDHNTVVALGALYGVDLNAPALKTPAQARAAGVPKDVIIGYCNRPLGSVKLLPASKDAIIRAFED